MVDISKEELRSLKMQIAKLQLESKLRRNLTAEIEHAVRFNGAEDGIDDLEGIVGVGLALEAISN